MNALAMLILEHDSHKNHLQKIQTDFSHFARLREEIIHHVNMEEAVLYPNLLRLPALDKAVREAWEEHNLIMQLIQEMDSLPEGSEKWKAKLDVLRKLLLIHIEDEEEKLFPIIKSLASEEFLCDVGEQMAVQKTFTPTEEIIYPEEEGSHKL